MAFSSSCPIAIRSTGLNPCPGCPSGFLYETSGGNSTRQSGQLQMRRRLRAGFAASLLYTYSKSIDNDAALGGQGYQTGAAQTRVRSWASRKRSLLRMRK